MKCACIAYTKAGEAVAKRIKDGIGDVTIFKNSGYDGGIKSIMGYIFESYGRIVFVCAAGIAVRMTAPYLKDKTKDPAVVVVDDMGRYAISLLSGHIGGANELAGEVAGILGAEAVITTASDIRSIESVDMFAKRYGLEIENMKDVKDITAIMVNGGAINFVSEIKASINYGNISESEYEGCILITSKEKVQCSKLFCILRPKNLNIGLGCRRGKSKEEILKAVQEVFKANNLSIKSVKSVSSIDIKKNETGIIEACEALACRFNIFSAKDIRPVEDRFDKSPFVESVVGVSSVAEPCACLAGGKLIVKRTAYDGVTVAVARED